MLDPASIGNLLAVVIQKHAARAIAVVVRLTHRSEVEDIVATLLAHQVSMWLSWRAARSIAVRRLMRACSQGHPCECEHS